MWGYVYAVCNQGHYASVKVGYTSSLAIENYVSLHYSRSLTPLEVVFAMPVANARLSEATLHHMLAPQRVDDNHELFDLSENMHKLEAASQVIMQQDFHSELPVPTTRPVHLEYWKIAKEAAKEGARRERKRKATAEAEMLRQEALRQKIEAKQEQERRDQQAEKEAEQRRRDEIENFQAQRQLWKEEEAERIAQEVQKQLDARLAGVGGFIRAELINTEEQQDYVQRSCMYQSYKMRMQREAQAVVGKKEFMVQLKMLMGEGGFHKRKRVGTGIHRDMWIGWKSRAN